MNEKDIKEFKKRLLDLRQKITEEIKHLGENSINQSQREASGDLSAYTFHMADVASDSFDRELSWDRVSVEQKVLYLIDDALKKIEENSYGICESCREKIKKERLKAIPYAKFCRDCTQKYERKKQ